MVGAAGLVGEGASAVPVGVAPHAVSSGAIGGRGGLVGGAGGGGAGG
eukprot:CAMPEP_0119080884 /NCGR_PEP_ID=MMETSP1178-20130426/114081_1 /TAXON_ID=33656 /ORGANISM="unid sp, Strain CCMP2000" /LENGTH=46 /DNA_ID= /DNA_START= /DNA_END= /DNA_ORIENTATION=